MLRRGFRNSVPPRAAGLPPTRLSLTDLPSLLTDRQLSDVCIGLPSSQGHMVRVLLRQRLSLLGAIEQAGVLAEQLASEQQEMVLSRELQPSDVHLVACADGCHVWLDYDLGSRGHSHPKVARRLTLLLWARPDPSLSIANQRVARESHQPTHASLDEHHED